MGQSGYGLTLVGGSTGAISGIKSVNVNGIDLAFDEIMAVDDTNRVSEHIPLGVTEGRMVCTAKWNKTIHAALKAAVLAQTSETWTLTDAGSSTFAGTGYVARVGDANLDTQGHQQFTFELQPATSWTFSA